MRLFRATKIDVPEYAGDLPCDEKTEPSADGGKASSSKMKKAKYVPDTGDEASYELFFVSLTVAVGAAIGLLRDRFC